MKYIKITNIALAAAAIAATACTDDFLERNTNQDQVQEYMMMRDNLATGSAFSQMVSNAIPTYQLSGTEEYGSDRYQIIQGLAGNIFSGYEGASNAGFSQNNVYNLNPDGWCKAQFEDSYVRIVSPWLEIDAVREELPEQAALADIVKVQGMHRVLESYGAIPYSEISRGNLTVSYDKQEDVYKKLFEELGNAIDLLTAFNESNPSSTILASYDNVFYGNVASWIRFANTLRLRLAMHVWYADEDMAKTQADAAIANSLGFLTATETVACHAGKGTWQNPIYVIEYEYNDGDAKAGATITTIMNGLNDPRRAKFFTAGSDGNYHGVRMGASVNATYPKSDLWSKVNCTKSDPLQWMAPAEGQFLLAEYYLRTGDEDKAKEAYTAGVEMSFETLGVSDAATYLAQTDAIPGSYTDPVNGSNSYSTALSSISVSWDGVTSFENHLEQIITQKYIAMFPEGQEAWTEFRRTGYPAVIPTARNNSNGTIDTEIQIRRLPYPSSEYSTNADNVAEGVTILNEESSNKKGDNGGTRLWWDKK